MKGLNVMLEANSLVAGAPLNIKLAALMSLLAANSVVIARLGNRIMALIRYAVPLTCCNISR
jgi:hypothetical protein